MRTSPLIILLSCAMLPIAPVRAGLINVNFTSTSPTAPAFDGGGFLGAGIWNRIQATSAMGQDASDTIALKNHAGETLAVTLTGKDSGVVEGATHMNGNAIQSESWIGNAPGALVFVELAGLIPGQVYQIIVYSNRVGSGAAEDIYIVAGEQVELPNSGEQDTALPGIEGEDYLLFTPAAGSNGKILIVAESIAGLQIEGRLLISEKAPGLDAIITNNPAALTGRGENVRNSAVGGAQTLTQKGKVKRPVNFYPVVGNDGTFIDRQSVQLQYLARDVQVVLIDRETGGNVTAAAKIGNHRFNLDGGGKRRFQMQLKPLKDKKTLVSASLCAKPSTGDTTLTDCVAGAVKLKPKR